MARHAITPAQHGLRALLAFSVVLAFYRGFRMPSLWTSNYYLLDIQHGFHRRFLLGTLLQPLGDARFHYHVIAAIQVAVTVMLACVIVCRAAKAPWHLQFLVAVFFASEFGAYFFYSVGYPEHLLFLMLFAALALPAIALPALVAGASILIHEAAAFITVPLLLCVQLVRGQYRSAAFAVALALLAFAYVAMHQTVDGALLDAYRAELHGKTDYNARLDYLEIFSNEFGGRRWMNHFKLREWREIVGAIVICAVAAAGLLPVMQPERKGWQAAIAGAAMLAPLALGFFGWDVYRWVFLSTCSAVFLVFWFKPDERAALALSSALLLFSMFAQLHYFFNDVPRALLPSAIADFVQNELPKFATEIPVR